MTSFTLSRLIINSHDAKSEAESQCDNECIVNVWGKGCLELKQTIICVGKFAEGI